MATTYRVYMDDSGNVDAHASNDPNLRYGSISAVIMRSDYIDATFNLGFRTLIRKHFGTNEDGSEIKIHRRVLASIPANGPFSILSDNKKRDSWNSESLSMFRRADYTVISACVDKVEWYYRYPEWSGDFYEVLVTAVLERIFYFLKDRGSAEVSIENKNPKRDENLKSIYRDAISGKGFQHISARSLQKTFSSVELNIFTKDECRPGAQMVDLIAGPAMQHIRHLHTRRHQITSAYVSELCRILEAEKFYRSTDLDPNGYGRIWRPSKA